MPLEASELAVGKQYNGYVSELTLDSLWVSITPVLRGLVKLLDVRRGSLTAQHGQGGREGTWIHSSSIGCRQVSSDIQELKHMKDNFEQGDRVSVWVTGNDGDKLDLSLLKPGAAAWCVQRGAWLTLFPWAL